MTASALAGELGLPLLVVQLHGLITKFMGETAAKLRLIFDAMEQTRGVYLFDEFDAIGGNRDLPNDVGEIRRVLNSFLQFLEQDQSDSLVIAATNHAADARPCPLPPLRRLRPVPQPHAKPRPRADRKPPCDVRRGGVELEESRDRRQGAQPR